MTAPIRFLSLLLLSLLPTALQAQTKVPDTVVFTNGEQLTGELLKANGGGITFKSTMAGEINVPWANIKTLNSSKSFAIPKSSSFGAPDRVTRMFEGLRSRCTMRFWCA